MSYMSYMSYRTYKTYKTYSKATAQIPRDSVLQAGLPSGDQSAVEPPGPIPNPEVKRCSANGSETIGLVRVGRRQVYARLPSNGAGLFFWEEQR